MNDLSECEFLNRKLIYYTYIEFCKRRFSIKKAYQELTIKQKKFYKWYVYANSHMSHTYKDIIWDYLNDYDDDEHLLKLRRWYKAR